MNDEANNKLTLGNASENLVQSGSVELGSALHSEALKRENQKRQDAVISEIQRLESNRLDYALKADFATRASNWYAGKLDAVKAGEFDFDLVHGQMIFHNPDFNRGNY